MKIVKITTEYITLGQMLKFTGIIREGYEAKSYLSSKKVEVNGESEARRGKKLYNGDKIFIEGVQYIIEANVLSK